MSTIILSPTGSSIGIGWAIPVNRIKNVTLRILYSWGRRLGWILAVLIVVWVMGRIYSSRLDSSGRL